MRTWVRALALLVATLVGITGLVGLGIGRRGPAADRRDRDRAAAPGSPVRVRRGALHRRRAGHGAAVPGHAAAGHSPAVARRRHDAPAEARPDVRAVVVCREPRPGPPDDDHRDHGAPARPHQGGVPRDLQGELLLRGPGAGPGRPRARQAGRVLRRQRPDGGRRRERDAAARRHPGQDEQWHARGQAGELHGARGRRRRLERRADEPPDVRARARSRRWSCRCSCGRRTSARGTCSSVGPWARRSR